MKCLAWFLLAIPSLSLGQVSADHPYNGINRPLTVDVRIPRGERGEAEIRLLEAVTAATSNKAKVSAGRMDLAKLFPELWTAKRPKLLYAQLVVGGRKIGPALVLQPMLNPPISRLKADGKTLEFVPDDDGPMYNGIRAYVDQDIEFDTSLGSMRFRMRPDAAPNTAWNIMQLVKGGLYTGTIFHRVVAKRADGTPFVIQGGDPTGTGSGGPGFAYPLENSTLPHDFGVISIARSTDPNTNGCQIFVCLSRAGTKHLDGKYAAFGQAISGGQTILKIGAVPVGKEDRPTNPPKIINARLVDAAPYGEGPKALVRPLAG
ncbi:peptidylprolyl isomerase [Fimbriimonas ginsengisoli]|uniref:peptidylprolyl isomerase n=1 Tax=Fimbriimonas ginsengisoli Gsoil 348 TaxID=661478 RepID=A0A068NQH7_FIMGI|nr:peptidylprolyl isomerase [Fimbriimonas ginsengisoli]AIE85607.1 Peptidyl-prolyl cis-trans isomerase [Fimbriimonas ginsengisoli Gsoil 348]